MDPFTAHLDRGILRLYWRRGVEITHPRAVAAARALAELHGPTALPLLVRMHGIAGITPEARVGMTAYRGFSRVALLGEDVVDEVMSGFSHRSPTATRYFTSETDAVAWLLNAGQARPPSPGQEPDDAARLTARRNGCQSEDMSHEHPGIQVSNDEAENRYVATLDGGPAGFAAYELSDDTIVFTHTVVHKEMEGRGIGSTLIRQALDDARERQLTVVPECEFVASFIDTHPGAAPAVSRPGAH